MTEAKTIGDVIVNEILNSVFEDVVNKLRIEVRKRGEWDWSVATDQRAVLILYKNAVVAETFYGKVVFHKHYMPQTSIYAKDDCFTMTQAEWSIINEILAWKF
jgi:hypothetical protein